MNGTSSSVQNRSLSDWYSSIKNGHIKLPRFQRMEAWLKNEGKEQFFIRRSASTIELAGEDTHKYITDDWE